MKDKTVFITGGSRGIGKAIGIRLAKEGANIVIAAKTAEPHPKLPGTIYTAAVEMEEAGGKALPLVVDIRSEELVENAVEKAVATFGGIDILINNASAINLASTEKVTMKRYDLMHQVNARGTFMCSKYCIPFLKQADNPHILTLSPPLNLKPEWFGAHLAYTLSKYGMSMVTLGLANELKKHGIAVNALWPQTAIATAAVQNLLGGDELIQQSRTTDIMADAAFCILSKKSHECTGNFFIDETLLRAEGVNDFSAYAVNPDKCLMKDFFV